MRFRTIRGCAQREYDEIVAAYYTRVVYEGKV